MEVNEDFAYWLGLVQADGFVSKYITKKQNLTKYEFGLETISEILAKEFSKGLALFGRQVSVMKTKRNTYRCRISANSILDLLHSMNIKLREKEYAPTDSICKSDMLFGAYLAGIIDGDGDVRIKRPAYPQCAIRISSGSVQPTLKELIKGKMKCGVSESGRVVVRNGKKMQWHELEFLVTSKNAMFIKNFVVSYIKLDYKREKIKQFMKTRW